MGVESFLEKLNPIFAVILFDIKDARQTLA